MGQDDSPQAELDQPLRYVDPERVKRLFIVPIDGELYWKTTPQDLAGDFDWGRCPSLPPLLMKVFKVEPLWVDLSEMVAKAPSDQLTNRYPPFAQAAARLAAPIRNIDIIKLVSEDYRKFKRRRQVAWAISGGLLGLLMLTLIGLLMSNLLKDITERQRTIS